MLTSCSVWRAFKLNVFAGGVRIERRRYRQSVSDFSKGLIELIENGEVTELDQRLGRKPDGIEVVIIQLDVIDAVAFLSIIIPSLIAMVFDGGVVPQVGFVPHSPEIFLNGRNADVLTVTAVQCFFMPLSILLLKDTACLNWSSIGR